MSGAATTAVFVDEGDDGMPPAAALPVVEADGMRAWAEALVDRARGEDVALRGEDGLLTSMVFEVLRDRSGRGDGRPSRL